MEYKILEAHIDFKPSEGRNTIKVKVAIQSNPDEPVPTHFKAYWKEFEKEELAKFKDVIYSTARSGSKIHKLHAGEIFPSLKHLGYY